MLIMLITIYSLLSQSTSPGLILKHVCTKTVTSFRSDNQLLYWYIFFSAAWYGLSEINTTISDSLWKSFSRQTWYCVIKWTRCLLRETFSSSLTIHLLCHYTDHLKPKNIFVSLWNTLKVILHVHKTYHVIRIFLV